MTLKELKQNILEGKLSNDFLILKCSDNHFIADQYLSEICSINGCMINYVDSIYESMNSSLALIMSNDSDINVVRVEEFSEPAEDYSDFKNTIVICDKISKKIESLVSAYVVEIPKLLDWQIKDYMKTICPGLMDSYYDWLYFVTDGDVYRLTNELDKIKLFDVKKRDAVLSALTYAPYSDLYKFDFKALADAIVAGDRDRIYEYLKHQNVIDVAPIGLANFLLGTYKRILYAFYPTNKTYAELGLSTAYANWIKNNTKHYTLETLRKILKFLSAIDLRLKDNEFEVPNNVLINYLICKLLSFNK